MLKPILYPSSLKILISWPANVSRFFCSTDKGCQLSLQRPNGKRRPKTRIRKLISSGYLGMCTGFLLTSTHAMDTGVDPLSPEHYTRNILVVNADELVQKVTTFKHQSEEISKLEALKDYWTQAEEQTDSTIRSLTKIQTHTDNLFNKANAELSLMSQQNLDNENSSYQCSLSLLGNYIALHDETLQLLNTRLSIEPSILPLNLLTPHVPFLFPTDILTFSTQSIARENLVSLTQQLNREQQNLKNTLTTVKHKITDNTQMYTSAKKKLLDLSSQLENLTQSSTIIIKTWLR